MVPIVTASAPLLISKPGQGGAGEPKGRARNTAQKAGFSECEQGRPAPIDSITTDSAPWREACARAKVCPAAARTRGTAAFAGQTIC
jgi:hypothetical protein